MQLVDAVCRPPRDVYEESDLVGGRQASFAFGESHNRIRKYYRLDIELYNDRQQRLLCSHYRHCVVTSKDGRLPCVVYCHTNSGSRRDAEEILFSLLPRGITVFAFDFAGSGLSDGDFVTLGAREVEDLEVVVKYLREEGSTSTIGLWGRSMGAVTALLYSQKDPSIAGVVVDSPFSRLVDLMLELATTSGFSNIPRPLVRVALGFLRRSVRRKAGFSIDSVSPLDTVPSTYVPTLFGHAESDTLVAPHHGEKLFVAHGADTKNFIAFEGDHNGVRPDFWYDSATIFLLGSLRVEELVGMDIDLQAIRPNEAPHLVGAGIYVAGERKQSKSKESSSSPSIPRESKEELEEDGEDVLLQRALQLSLEESHLGGGGVVASDANHFEGG
jgi:pimeloyl-ACP methyl ester carboxylesterase